MADLPVRYPDKVPETLEEMHQYIIELIWQLGIGCRGYWDDRVVSVGTTETAIAHYQRAAPQYAIRPIGTTAIGESKAPDDTYIYLIAAAPTTCRLLITPI